MLPVRRDYFRKYREVTRDKKNEVCSGYVIQASCLPPDQRQPSTQGTPSPKPPHPPLPFNAHLPDSQSLLPDVRLVWRVRQHKLGVACARANTRLVCLDHPCFFVPLPPPVGWPQLTPMDAPTHVRQRMHADARRTERTATA
eukprot:248793-Chlamydomonas_euryale.AAC.2